MINDYLWCTKVKYCVCIEFIKSMTWLGIPRFRNSLQYVLFSLTYQTQENEIILRYDLNLFCCQVYLTLKNFTLNIPKIHMNKYLCFWTNC